MSTILTPFLDFDLDFEQHSFFQTNVAAVARRYETMSSTESGNDSGLPFWATKLPNLAKHSWAAVCIRGHSSLW